MKAEYELYELRQRKDPAKENTEGALRRLHNAERKESTLEQKLIRTTNELERERQSSRALEEAIKALTEGISSKDSEMLLFTRKVEELTERKNKLQKECISLRDENKALAQANASLEAEAEEYRKQFVKIQEEARVNVDELRNSLKKNSILTRQVAVTLSHTA